MYPENIDGFIKKLNKVDNKNYVIEEEVSLINGVYEGELEHDNANVLTISVWSGAKLTGQKVDNFIVSTPSNAPWKKIIKIFSKLQKVYITYETPGDMVEAEDINKLQESIVEIKRELTQHKEDLSVHFRDYNLDGGSFV
jgi:hypothetical protein